MTKQDHKLGLEDALALLKDFEPQTIAKRDLGRFGLEITPTADTTKVRRAIAAVEAELKKAKNDL